MEKELKKLNNVKDQIEKGLINFRKSPKDQINNIYVEARLEMLEIQFKNFNAKYEALVGECEGNELEEYFQEDVCEKVYETYLIYKVELKNTLSQLQVHSSKSEVCDGSSDSVVRLPKIVLPTFSGKYTEWSSFRNLFTSLVNNNKRLDDVQRLHYLKTQVSGEAEQLIRHIPITDVNYRKAWEILEHRYNNKKFMSTCILNRLFGQRSIAVESSKALKDLLDVTSDCLHELSNIGIDVSSWDVIIVYVISLKLDVESRKQWELHVTKSSDDLPSFEQLRDFLETRFRALECVEPKHKPMFNNPNTSHANVMHAAIKIACPHCSESHKLTNCKKFGQLDIDKRRAISLSLGVCFNCLGSHHTSKICRVLSRCRICKRKHHTLLHPRNLIGANRDIKALLSATPQESTSEPVHDISAKIATHFVNEQARGQVLLPTALVKAESQNGCSQVLRALLDQGSQASFITEAAVQLLRLRRVVSETTIAGIGAGHGDIVSRHVVNINIKSLHDPSFTLNVTAHVLKSLSSVMPDNNFELERWPEIQSIRLADPKFNFSNKIDILLGAEAYCHILKQGLIKSPTGSLTTQDTHLGWIVSGHVRKSDESQNSHNSVIAMHTRIKYLWELDSGPALSENFYASVKVHELHHEYTYR